MPAWAEFAEADAELAAFARARLQGRIAYLATIRRDGGPRVHPVTPIVSESALFVFMEATSPKGHDLRRDPRYAMHAGVEDSEGGGGELIVTGTAQEVTDGAARREAIAAAAYEPHERYLLFGLDIGSVLATTYDGDKPVRRRWPPES